MTQEMILDVVACGVFTVDGDLRITTFNQTATRITGFGQSEAVGQRCRDLFGSARCDQGCALQRSVRTGEATPHWDVNLPDARGEEIPVCASTAPLKDKEGKSIGGVMTFRVLSALKEAYNEVDAERRRITAILNSIEDGVLTIDQNWRITSFNRGAETITGFSAEDVIGKPCRTVFGKGPRGKNLCGQFCPVKQVLQTGQPISDVQSEILNRGGKRVVLRLNASVLRDETGETIGAVETFRNISDLVHLRDQVERKYGSDGMIGRSPAMRRIYDLIRDIADTEAIVLIQGETGTGKELVAAAIHHLSSRKDGPFVKLNCSALPEGLLESELFGHVRGAFTGAVRDKPGRFELAEGGTLLLDEIGDVSPSIQVKLLRVLEDQTFERVGGTETVQSDVRLIAATNRNLKEAIRQKAFREDLYYRLNVLPIWVPPLRERAEDIPLLVGHFLRQHSPEKPIQIAPQVTDLLVRHAWPGNVRELENAVEYALLHSKNGVILPEHLPPDVRLPGQRELDPTAGLLQSSEREAIRQALEMADGNRQEAARLLGISRATLYRKMKRCGLYQN